MAAFTESFFDDPNTEGFNLWSKVPEDYQPADEPVLHKGGLFKFSKAKNSWKQRHFVDELAKCTDRIDLRPVCFQIYCIRENRHQEISIDFPNPLPNAP